MKSDFLEIKTQEDIEIIPKHILFFKLFKQILKLVILFLIWILSLWTLYILVTGKFLYYFELIDLQL